MKFLAQILAIIVAVLVAHYLPAPDPENFAAVPSAPWYVWLILAWIGVQSWPTLRARGQDVWGWVRERMLTRDASAGMLATTALALLLGFAVGFTLGGMSWKPSPPSPPTPVVDPVVPEVVGPRRLFLLHETSDNDPTFDRVITKIRTDDATLGYLKSRQHVLDVLDLDAKQADGSAAPIVTEFKTKFPAVKPPALLQVAKDGKAAADSVAGKTAEEIIGLVKARDAK